MSSAFNLLTAGGARFDKKRFQRDHDLFSKDVKKQKSDKGKGKAQTLSPVQSTAALPPALNIFSDPAPRSAPTPAKRKKALTRSNDDDDDDSDSESSTSSSSSHPSHPTPRQQKITITGPDPLPASLSTSLLSLLSHPSHPLSSSSGRPLLRALKASGIASLWGVQTSVAGCLLAGKDVLCVAPTGSGKTLAYILPTLVQLRDPARTKTRSGSREEARGMQGIRAVVLVPTHDLGRQIYGVVKAVTKGRGWRVILMSRATEKAVCQSSPGAAFGAERGDATGGKEGMDDSGSASEVESADEDEDENDDESEGDDDDDDDDDDIETVEDEARKGGGSETQADRGPLGIDILISTPERLHHLIESGQLSLSATRHIILDESDRLLSSDFLPQVEPIVRACPDAAQKCLLSATMPAGSEEIARTWMKEGGVRVVVGVKDSAVATVAQSLLYTATEPGKVLALRQLIATGGLPYPSLIFVQSIQRAEDLHRQLVMDGVRADMVHGSRSAAARDSAVRAFREGTVWVLVVTEVLARGMDFGGVKVVLNYDLPQTVQSYVHRIGRTGRAGRPGMAITFFSDEDKPYLRSIANVLVASGCPVPQYIQDMPNPSKDTRRHWAKAPVKRKQVGGAGRDLAKEERRKKAEMRKGSQRRKAKATAAAAAAAAGAT